MLRITLRKIHIILAVLLTAIVTVNVTGDTALATSVYDNNYTTTSTLTVGATAYGVGCDDTDVTSSWTSYILDSSKWRAGSDLSTARSSLSAALADEAYGQWGASQFTQVHGPNNGNGYSKYINIYWSQDPSTHLDWTTNGWDGGSFPYNAVMYSGSNVNVATIRCSDDYYGDNNPEPVVIGTYLNQPTAGIISTKPNQACGWQAGQIVIWCWASNLLIYNTNKNLPQGYQGPEVKDMTTDTDGDGLIQARETAQGTTEGEIDTDGDGLNDQAESIWNSNRDTIFCGSQCAYPNPTKKDLYVEVDWMKEPGANGRSFQPSSSQISSVRNAYNTQGINAHFDTGQYGGGNELPVYTQSLRFVPDTNNIDFYDYKNGNGSITANFNPSRSRLWHYVISGYQYNEYPDSSGASYAGDDDSFLSTGLIKDGQSDFGYLDFNTALSGTFIHELGHSLCLSSVQQYSSQSQQCIYSGVDAYAGSSYDSSMNYENQMFMVDYSKGLNGSPADHDDWTAVAAGINDFADITRNEGDSLSHGKTAKEKRMKRGISISQAQELRRQGKLGKNNLNFFTQNHR